MSARSVGLRGQAASAFARGQGRVLIEGNEWAAKADLPLAAGDAVEVVGVDGALLHVRRA
jgi:membrane protein implicated in regulation of membrane protease activity